MGKEGIAGRDGGWHEMVVLFLLGTLKGKNAIKQSPDGSSTNWRKEERKQLRCAVILDRGGLTRRGLLEEHASFRSWGVSDH